MMSRVWGLEDEEEAASWRSKAIHDENLPTFKAMLDEEWYASNGNNHSNNNNNHNNQESCFNVVEMKDFGYPSLVNAHPEANNMLLQSMNSSSSSPSSIFSLDPSQVQSFLSGTPHNSHCHHAIPQSFLTDVAGSSSFDGSMELPCEGIVGNSGANASNNSSTYVSSFGALFNPRNRASPLHSLSPRSPMGGFPGSSPHSQITTPNPSPHSQMGGTPNLSPRMPINGGGSSSNLCDQGFLNNNMSNLISGSGFGNLMSGGVARGSSSLLVNRAKLLRPLEISPTMGAQPTLFQKRAALRHTLGSPPAPLSRSIDILDEESPNTNTNSANTASSMKGKRRMLPVVGRKDEQEGKHREDEDVEESNDGSGVHYDTDDGTNANKPEETGDDCLASAGTNTGAPSNNNGGGGGADKGKKKGLPAKNLMAERRRRKKLNDRLYMLRSVVPKISKMDRASILGDAIDYLKELLQRINDLHNELESTSQGSVLPGASSFNPVTPPALPCRVKEECPSSLPSPNSQPARVEVRAREGRALNIHMFCARRPGLLLSTMRALDGLGLDVQQAVISCFNGFALDVFRAEQSKEGDIPPEEIKAVLLHTAGCHTTI